MSKYFHCLLFVLSVACYGGHSLPSETQLRAGDIVFRKGYGVKSRAVLHADKSSVYSHVGIIVQDKEKFFVIHITPEERSKQETVDKTKMERLEDFFASEKAEHGAFMRFADSAEISQSAARQAFRLYKKQVTFDHDYDLSDTNKMYCSELVWYAYNLAGRDITEGRRHVIKNFPIFSGTHIFPSDIYEHEKLKTYYKF
ncbi:MAG: hypothetical protein LBQ31_10830 [Bacteroidales bacterium]|jgi:uncharacterized protein YycO|nr:hypothetical protein [Bacteroidales bacterium]